MADVTDLYIEVDSVATKETQKHYGFVIETVIRGNTYTVEGFGTCFGTYHKAVLDALANALERYKRPCEVTIHSQDSFVLSMIEQNLQQWAESDFLNSKGRPVKNQEEWRRVHEKSQGMIWKVSQGKHAYTGWLRREIQKRKEQENG